MRDSDFSDEGMTKGMSLTGNVSLRFDLRRRADGSPILSEFRIKQAV